MLEKLKCQSRFFRLGHFAVPYLRDLLKKRRKNEQVPTTLSHSNNKCVNHVFSGCVFFLPKVQKVFKVNKAKLNNYLPIRAVSIVHTR